MSVMDRFSTITFPWGRRPPSLEEMIDVARHAESLGFYSLNLPMVNHPGTTGNFAHFGNRYSLDVLVVLPLLISATNSIRIAVDAVHLPTLPPVEWAKYFATLDVISGGRIIVGMCPGMSQATFDAVGVERKYRGRMSDEQLEVITRLWTEESVTHDGEFYHLKDATVDPKPVQKPHPPIWWAGETRSIPRAARYAQVMDPPWPTIDAVRNVYVPGLEKENKRWGTKTRLAPWFYTRITPDREMSDDEINEWFGEMLGHYAHVAPKDITLAGSPEQWVARIKAYEDAGVDHFVLDFQRHGLDPSETAIEQMHAFVGKVIRKLE